MKLGIVGLPNVGKSSLFNAITKAGAISENYPFCTIEPNIGIATVPDDRLFQLAKLYNSKKIVPAVVEFVDIAGLVKGASKGEGLGNKFLSHIREVDAIVEVVRCFENKNIVHVDGKIDPLRDIETIELELLLSDLEQIDRKIVKTSSMAKSGNKKHIEELNALKKVKKELEKEVPVRCMTLNETEQTLVEELCLLTSKSIIYVCNISEDDIKNPDNEYVKKVKNHASENGGECIVLSVKIEEEIQMLESEEEKEMFKEELGIDELGLAKLIKTSYKQLGLISFLTAGEKEVKAWTIKKGTKAPQAAGVIHTDFERGFIRAEIVEYDTLIKVGSFNKAKEKGLVRSEGKEYVVQEGDVILFRFNV